MKFKITSILLLFSIIINLSSGVVSHAENNTSVEYTIQRDDASWYNANGELKLSQYYDKVVLNPINDNCVKINNLIQQESDKFLADANEQISFTKENPSPYDGWYSNYSDTVVTTNGNGILSIKTSYVWFMGGVASYGDNGLNFNLNTGEILSLTDVLSLNKSEIEQYLKEQTKQYIADNPDKGWWNDEIQNAVSTVDSYTLEQFHYYIENDNIYLCYPKYELGPGVMGPVTVCCPITKPKKNIAIVLNGQELSFDQPPINTPEGRLLVPIRKIAESMNKLVLWSDETKTAFIDNSDNGLIIPLYEMQMYIANENGFAQWQRVPLDVPAMEINGRTLVPVRAFCESLGADVRWVDEEKTAYITYDDTVTKGRMNDTLFDSICLTYYIEKVADNPFTEYSVSIDDFYDNRTDWIDAVTMGLSDPFAGVNDLISGSSNAVNIIKMSLSEIISEIPNGKPSDYDAGIVKLLKDAVAIGVDIYSDVGGLNSTIRNYSEVYRTLDDALLDYSKNYHNKVSGIFDLSVFSLEELAYILTDYECNIEYINAFENGLQDAGLLNTEISEAIDLLRTDYSDKFIGVVLDLRGQLFEYGVTESLAALLDSGVGLGKLAWDAFFTVMGVNSQGEDLKVFYGIYCIDTALNNAVSNKMSYDKPNTSAEILEFRSLWEMTRAEKITAYKAMKGITNKKDSKEYADEQIEEISAITYRLFK